MTDFGEASFIAGIDLTRDMAANTIKLSQEQYTNQDERLHKYSRGASHIWWTMSNTR